MRAPDDRGGPSGGAARALLAVAFLAAGAFGAGAARAQTCPPPCLPAVPTDSVVVVDASDVLPPVNSEGYGVLRRTGGNTPAPLIATYMGLSAVGATLAAVTSQRRVSRKRERERQTGIAHGRRRRDEFWTEPLPASAAPLGS